MNDKVKPAVEVEVDENLLQPTDMVRAVYGTMYDPTNWEHLREFNGGYQPAETVTGWMQAQFKAGKLERAKRDK